MSCFGRTCLNSVREITPWDSVPRQEQENFTTLLTYLNVGNDKSYKLNEEALRAYTYKDYDEALHNFIHHNDAPNPNRKYYDDIMEERLELLHSYLEHNKKGGTNRKSRNRKDKRKKHKGRARTRKYTRF